jgi:hypothetical protein
VLGSAENYAVLGAAASNSGASIVFAASATPTILTRLS